MSGSRLRECRYAATKGAVISLVRSMAAPLSPAKIQINALAPSVLRTSCYRPGPREALEDIPTDVLAETNIAPAELFKDMIITPMETLTNGVAQLVDNPALTGQIAEIHGDKVTLRAAPEWVDDDSRRNIEMFSTLGYA